MQLHELEKLPEVKRRKRVGRGTGSGHGRSATKGNKGQKARAGGPKRVGFEGGQLPLYRRLPYQKGFKPLSKEVFFPVNLVKLNSFGAGSTVTRGLLYERGMVPSPEVKVKVLAGGVLKVNLIVQVQAFSAKAKDQIEALGGKAEVA
jgi:large subunit ribosomal protein L15